jgi:hypothetical protein
MNSHYFTFNTISKITHLFIPLSYKLIMMDINDFKAGKFRKGFEYQYFMPQLVNHSFAWQDAGINELLEQASLKNGELNAFARLVPDVGVLIKMHVYKEAVVSSRLEGTQRSTGTLLTLPSFKKDIFHQSYYY